MAPAIYKLDDSATPTWDPQSHTKRPRWANLEKGSDDPTTGKPCAQCENFTGGGLHFGSPNCKSYGIAAGGTRVHCTCDACF